MRLSREQERALVEALEHGGCALTEGSVWMSHRRLAERDLSYPENIILSEAGQILAQAIKDRDNREERWQREMKAHFETAADAWDEGFNRALQRAGHIDDNPYRKHPLCSRCGGPDEPGHPCGRER